MKKSITTDIAENGLDALGKYESIISLNSKEVLYKINACEKYKILEVIDNIATPENSVSKKCQCKNCNKRIRYEYIVKENGKEKAYGFDCVSELMELSNAKAKLLKKIPEMLKRESKLEEWLDEIRTYGDYKVSNRKVIEKLHELNKSGLLVFKPYFVMSKIEPLCDEDLDYIWYTNKSKTRKRALQANNINILIGENTNSKELNSMLNHLELNKDLNKWQQQKYEELMTSYGVNGKCPKCGGNLALRKSAYGMFLGCENFALGCKYTKSLAKK